MSKEGACILISTVAGCDTVFLDVASYLELPPLACLASAASLLQQPTQRGIRALQLRALSGGAAEATDRSRRFLDGALSVQLLARELLEPPEQGKHSPRFLTRVLEGLLRLHPCVSPEQQGLLAAEFAAWWNAASPSAKHAAQKACAFPGCAKLVGQLVALGGHCGETMLSRAEDFVWSACADTQAPGFARSPNESLGVNVVTLAKSGLLWALLLKIAGLASQPIPSELELQALVAPTDNKLFTEPLDITGALHQLLFRQAFALYHMRPPSLRKEALELQQLLDSDDASEPHFADLGASQLLLAFGALAAAFFELRQVPLKSAAFRIVVALLGQLSPRQAASEAERRAVLALACKEFWACENALTSWRFAPGYTETSTQT